MVVGLLIAVFFSYRKPRVYDETKVLTAEPEEGLNKRNIAIAALAILATLFVQLETDSMIFGALVGFMIFSFSGALKHVADQDIFTQGVRMMANIGFIMISAAGFAAVVKATGEVGTLVRH